MSIDLRNALRRRKPERRRTFLKPRPEGELLHVDALGSADRVLLVPDTNVYIMAAGGTLPIPVRTLLIKALQFLSDGGKGRVAGFDREPG